jgi:hypothetical protein
MINIPNGKAYITGYWANDIAEVLHTLWGVYESH